MSRGTIKVPKDVKERHNERRKELGLTWAEYLDAMAPEGPDEFSEEQEARIREIVREELADR